LRIRAGSVAAGTGDRPFARGPASALTAIEDHLRNTASDISACTCVVAITHGSPPGHKAPGPAPATGLHRHPAPRD
jgi:hypothetical protein